VPRGKMPWEKFYFADWLGDSGLLAVSIEAEGAWIRACAFMLDRKAHKLTKTVPEWAALWRCTPAKASKIIAELEREKVAVVTRRHKNVTLLSRRYKRRYLATCRKRRQRSRQGSRVCRGEKLEARSQKLEVNTTGEGSSGW